jgi:hypothetical protein
MIASDHLDVSPGLPEMEASFRANAATPERKPQNQRFRHDENFTWVEVDGRHFKLSPHRALVVACLHRLGEPTHEEVVFEELAGAIESRRIHDVFRHSPLLGVLVIRTAPATYGLKYYD